MIKDVSLKQWSQFVLWPSLPKLTCRGHYFLGHFIPQGVSPPPPHSFPPPHFLARAVNCTFVNVDLKGENLFRKLTEMAFWGLSNCHSFCKWAFNLHCHKLRSLSPMKTHCLTVTRNWNFMFLSFLCNLTQIWPHPVNGVDGGPTAVDGSNSEFNDNNDVDYGIVHIFHEKRPEGESTTDRPFFNFNNRKSTEHNNEKPPRKTTARRNCTTQTQIIDRLLNGTGYNKYRIPEENGVDVAIEFWLQAISSISEITNDFEMDIYINEMWLDPALNFEHMSPCKQNLTLSHQVLEKLWTPNSCFINSKVAQIHNSPFQNIFLMLYPNGTIWVNYRVRVKGPCAMDLTNFPMDIQTCHLIYESFNYNNQEVRMRWNSLNPTPVYPINTILLPDFNLVNIQAYLVVEPYPAGMWDELHVKLSFERRYVWYFMQAYVPTYLTIFISWVSFSLGSKAIPARTMLGVNALLAMIFQFGNIMRNLPRVSYVKAIDVWMLGAMFFIFCSLLELAIVGFKVREMPLAHTRSKRTPAGPITCNNRREEENGRGPMGNGPHNKQNIADGASDGDLSPKFGGTLNGR